MIANTSGTTIQLTDSSDKPLQGLTIYGKSTQDGTPAPELPIPITNVGDNGNIELTVTGANLLDYSNVSSKSENGVTFTVNKDGSIAISGTATSETPLSLYLTDSGLGANTYCVSGGTSNANVRIAYNDGNGFQYILNNQSKPLSDFSSYSAILYQVYVSPGKTVNEMVYPMLNIGSTPLPWEPYKPTQTLTLTTSNGLPGIPVASGGNVTIDGQQYITDTIELYADGTGKRIQHVGVITSYNGEDVGDVWMSTTGQLTTGAKVIYQLAGPVGSELALEEIQAYKNLYTYYPNTTISNSDNAYMDVRYIADTKLYIDQHSNGNNISGAEGIKVISLSEYQAMPTPRPRYIYIILG